jgi:hypothetical protein
MQEKQIENMPKIKNTYNINSNTLYSKQTYIQNNEKRLHFQALSDIFEKTLKYNQV